MPDGAQLWILRALWRAPVRIRRHGVLRGGRAHLVGRGHGRQRGGEGCVPARKGAHIPVNCGPRGRELVPPVPARGSPRGRGVRVLPHVRGDLLLALRHRSQRGERSGLWQGCAGGVFGVHRHRALPLRAADGRLLPGEYKLAQAAIRRPGDRGPVHVVQQGPRGAPQVRRREDVRGVLVLALRGSEGVFRRGCRHSLRGVLPQRVGEGHAGGGGVLRGGYPGISDVDFGGRTEVRRGEDAR
mmetsp:Transcript_8353/g.34165  ORF Transcript_8353/g.34165 Transcript_8353/m.34165 type:complete len:242 (-) Transcript_8353:1422-2147(-)